MDKMQHDVPEVSDVVVVVDFRPITVSSIASLRDDIRANQSGDAVSFEHFAHHSITGSQIEHAQFVERLGNCVKGSLEKVGYLTRRVAVQTIVKNLLVQTGPLVDVGVVMEPQTVSLAVLDQTKKDFILSES